MSTYRPKPHRLPMLKVADSVLYRLVVVLPHITFQTLNCLPFSGYALVTHLVLPQCTATRPTQRHSKVDRAGVLVDVVMLVSFIGSFRK